MENKKRRCAASRGGAPLQTGPRRLSSRPLEHTYIVIAPLRECARLMGYLGRGSRVRHWRWVCGGRAGRPTLYFACCSRCAETNSAGARKILMCANRDTKRYIFHRKHKNASARAWQASAQGEHSFFSAGGFPNHKPRPRKNFKSRNSLVTLG